MEERSVIIMNGDVVVKHLAVLVNRYHLVQYAIKLGERHYLIISRDKFHKIIRTARENGFLVFDYTDFD
jgi:hypothetical protein